LQRRHDFDGEFNRLNSAVDSVAVWPGKTHANRLSQEGKQHCLFAFGQGENGDIEVSIADELVEPAIPKKAAEALQGLGYDSPRPSAVVHDKHAEFGHAARFVDEEVVSV